MVELFIAKKHILDRKFQSFISMFGIAIALIALVVSLAISNGLKNTMIKSILTISPHINVMIENQTEGEYKNIIEDLKKLKIKNINPRIETQGLVNVSGSSVTSLIYATNLDNLNIKLIEGKKDNLELNEVIVGNEFLKKTGAFLGDEITVITTETKEIRVKIVGVFKTGFYNYDSNLVIMPLKTMQLLKEEGEYISNIAIEVDNPDNIKQLHKLTDEINTKYLDKLYSYSWDVQNQSLLNAINFEKFVLVAILSLIVLISSFAISVILIMIVREKISDIGILKAMGYSNENILKIFLYEGLIIGFFGIIISLLMSPIIIVFLKYIYKKYVSNTYYLDTLPTSMSLKEFSIIYVVVILLIIISTIFPALKASKMNPLDAIKTNN